MSDGSSADIDAGNLSVSLSPNDLQRLDSLFCRIKHGLADSPHSFVPATQCNSNNYHCVFVGNEQPQSDSESDSEPESKSNVDSNIGASSEADTVTHSEDKYQRLLLDEHRQFDTDDAATAADSDNDSVYAGGQ